MSKLEKKEERLFAGLLRRETGLRAIKFSDSGRRGAPDRLVLLPGGRCVFVEFKRAGEKLREEQVAYHEVLTALGHCVVTCYTAKTAVGIVQMQLEGGNCE